LSEVVDTTPSTPATRLTDRPIFCQHFHQCRPVLFISLIIKPMAPETVDGSSQEPANHSNPFIAPQQSNGRNSAQTLKPPPTRKRYPRRSLLSTHTQLVFPRYLPYPPASAISTISITVAAAPVVSTVCIAVLALPFAYASSR